MTGSEMRVGEAWDPVKLLSPSFRKTGMAGEGGKRGNVEVRRGKGGIVATEIERKVCSNIQVVSKLLWAVL